LTTGREISAHQNQKLLRRTKRSPPPDEPFDGEEMEWLVEELFTYFGSRLRRLIRFILVGFLFCLTLELYFPMKDNLFQHISLEVILRWLSAPMRPIPDIINRLPPIPIPQAQLPLFLFYSSGVLFTLMVSVWMALRGQFVWYLVAVGLCMLLSVRVIQLTFDFVWQLPDNLPPQLGELMKQNKMLKLKKIGAALLLLLPNDAPQRHPLLGNQFVSYFNLSSRDSADNGLPEVMPDAMAQIQGMASPYAGGTGLEEPNSCFCQTLPLLIFTLHSF
jgi:hypothetical protein